MRLHRDPLLLAEHGLRCFLLVAQLTISTCHCEGLALTNKLIGDLAMHKQGCKSTSCTLSVQLEAMR